MIVGWAGLSALTPDIPALSAKGLALVAVVALISFGGGIVESARKGLWPWELRADGTPR